MTNDKTKNTKRAGQGRAERRGEPVYTAIYKVNRSDTLLEFLLRKCKTSRNNVKAILSRRQVLVNGSVVTQFDFPLAKDDEVKLSKNSVQGSSVKTPAKDKPREKKTTAATYQDYLRGRGFYRAGQARGLAVGGER